MWEDLLSLEEFPLEPLPDDGEEGLEGPTPSPLTEDSSSSLR